MSSPPHESGTDFHSLERSTAHEAAAEAEAVVTAKKGATDFQTLKTQLPDEIKTFQDRSATDALIDVLTPVMIFIMVWAVIFFLLDVRFIYSEVHDQNIRMVAFFFLLGIVALNRLVAQDGSDESLLYIFVFVGAMGLYTLATSTIYDVGSVARNFLDGPWIGAAFNMTIVAFLWWVTNRLMHECCIDENRTAGEVGILTGTVRSFQKAIQPKTKTTNTPTKPKRVKSLQESMFERMDIEPIDPHDWKPQEKKAPPPSAAASQHLSNRHPGISIFYFSVPVMFIFSVGLPALRQGGPDWIRTGHLYVAVYTVTALSLLLLTSLGGLRQYFRSRRVHFPASIGWFWIGLGIVMIAMVSVGALQLPRPELPPLANIGEHETDYWTRTSTFELQSPLADAVARIEESGFMDRLGQGVMGIFALFFLYGLVQAAGALAGYIGRNRNRFPRFVVRFFEILDAFLLRVIRAPKLPTFKARRRVDRGLATSTRFRNPLDGQGASTREDTQRFIEVSYDALCALAQDMGVPRETGQTPYEFIQRFPKELYGLKKEALELTEMYVQSAYSDEPLDEKALDRLRKFWIAFEKNRRRVVR